MLRKSVVILAMLLSSLATQAFALGLGTVTVESALNQPLRVRIEILQLGDTRLQDISIQMASVDDFQRFNIERIGFLSDVSFSIATSPNGNFVTLTSSQIVREPYLSFILDTRWPNGRLLSEHTVLLDLPVFDSQQQIPSVRQPISPVLQSPGVAAQPQVSAPVTPAPQVTAPVTAPATAPAASAPTAPAAAEIPAEPVVVPEPAAPVAVAPAPATNVDIAPPAAQAEPEPEPAPVPEPADVIPAPDAAAAAETIETSDEDTLSDIALQVRPDDSVSMQQTMLAIQRLNPDAFTDGNINRMRSGQVLRVPDLAEIQSLDAREAASEINRQNQQFSSADVQPLAAPAPQAPAQDAAPQGQLSVVSADDTAIDASGGAGQLEAAENTELDQQIAQLENQLATQQEEADRARIEREELDARMDELEQQIAAAQEIIRLQDLQLAQLQDSLAQAAEQQSILAEAEIQIAAQTAERTSLLGDVMRIISGNLLFVGFGLVLVILPLVVLLLRRNRAKLDDADLNVLERDDYIPQQTRTDEDDEDQLKDFLSGDLDDELDEIIGVNADSDPVEQATTLLSKGNIDRAIALLQEALEESPDDQEIRFKLLEALAAQGDLSAFEEQADIIGDDPEFASRIKSLRRSIKVNESKPVSKPVSKSALQPELKQAPKPKAPLFGKKASSDEEDRIGAASFLDDLGIDLDAFDDEDDEPSVTEHNVKPAPVVPEKKTVPRPAPAPILDKDNFHPDDMDLTFDLVGEVEDTARSSQKVDDIKTAAIDLDDTDTDIDLDDDFESDVVTAGSSEDAAVEFSVDDLPGTSKSGGSKDASELDIEAFEFSFDDKPAATAASSKEPEMELETFAFDTSGLNLGQPVAPQTKVAADEENLLDFDFDKTEIQPAKAAAQTAADELDTFDFDLDASPVATVVDKSNAGKSNADDALDIDTDDFDLDDDTLAAGVAADADTVIDSAADADIDFDFDDDDEITEDTVSAAVTDSLDDELDDLDFLSDDDAVEVESVGNVTELSNFDEVATKLELAYAYRKMGDVEGAREILAEVLEEGTPGQAKEAKGLLASIKND